MPPSAPARPATLVTFLLLAGAAPARGQGLPPYSSMNPMVFSRTGLASFPYVEPGKRWRVTALMDYASPIEFADDPARGLFYVMDAELLKVELTATRQLSKRSFLLVQGSFNGAYDGFLDGFLDWYHNLIGLQVGARKIRPRNQFAYELALPDGRVFDFHKSSGYLGDLRLGAGFRHSPHWQSVVSVTLPTSGGPDGFSRGVASVNGTTMLRTDFAKRFTYEGSAGAGYTPTHGALAEFQRTTFLMVSQGLRGRVAGPLSLYSNIIYHSSLYHGIGTPELDGHELTIDVGGYLKFHRGPEWILGLTEDLKPSGPAIDVDFRIGARW
jgi:hypothetical protein